MEIMGALFFAVLLGYALLGMLLSPGLKMGQALYCSLCMMLFVSFYGCIFLQWMKPVAWGLMMGGLAGLAAAAFKWRALRGRMTSPALAVYAACAAAVVMLTYGIEIRGHDDMSYWGRAVKELYSFDRFYIHGDSSMYHMDYIPLLASLQYCVVRVFGWQDAGMAYVTAACVIVSIALMCEGFEKRRAGLAMGAAFAAAFCLYGFRFWDLRADGPMLMMFTAALFSLLARRENSAAAYAPALGACAVLVGFKIYSGLMFAAVVAAAMFVEWIRLRRGGRSSAPLGRMLASGLVLMLVMQFGWSMLYNYASAAAEAEAAALEAEYLGHTLTGAEAPVTLQTLLAGNPRTEQLMDSLTAEKFQNVWALIRETWTLYAESSLWHVWLFLIPALIAMPFAEAEKRRTAIRMLLLLLLVSFVYLLGLFGSYFVQAETAPAAVNYLKTVSVPLLLAALFLPVWLAQGRMKPFCYAAAAVMTAVIAVQLPWSVLWTEPEDDGSYTYTSLAQEYYEYEIEGLLTEEDRGKRAVLIENSYGAAEVYSQSGKTHAYAYEGLPVRVLEPYYYIYGDYRQLDEFDAEELIDWIVSRRPDLLLLRVEDFLYWEAIGDALGLLEEGESTGVYDVSYENGELILTQRYW